MKRKPITWLEQHPPRKWVGLYGVGDQERPLVRAVGRIYLYSGVLIAMLLLWEWQLERLGQLTLFSLHMINAGVWAFFLSQWLVLFSFCENKKQFLKWNWMVILIVLMGVPFLFNYQPIVQILSPFRPILALLILVPFCRDVWRFFIDGRLSTTMLATLIIVVVFGFLEAGIDPGIGSPGNGLWWAVNTVSSVGYGDVVPITALGRLLGGVLIVIGFIVFVAITSNVLSLMLRRETSLLHKEEKEVTQLLLEVDQIKRNQEDMLQVLTKLEEKLHKLSKHADKAK